MRQALRICCASLLVAVAVALAVIGGVSADSVAAAGAHVYDSPAAPTTLPASTRTDAPRVEHRRAGASWFSTASSVRVLAPKAGRSKLGRLADERGGSSSIPGFPYRGPNAPERAYENLAKNHGVDRGVASDRLHKLKEGGGLGATDDVVIGRTGDVYDARTEELLGSLTDKSLGR